MNSRKTPKSVTLKSHVKLLAMKQLSLIPKTKTDFGGSLKPNQRKTWRPLSTSKSIHLVLKSKKKFLFREREKIQSIIERQADLAGVKIYALSVQNDHIHHAITLQ